MRNGQRHPGYSMVFWAVFIALVFLPLLNLAIDVGRYSYARAEIAKAADASALAAAIEIDRVQFREGGRVVLSSAVWSHAQAFASMNSQYLSRLGIFVVVTSIHVDESDNSVTVVLSAVLDPLMPGATSGISILEIGRARVTAEARSE